MTKRLSVTETRAHFTDVLDSVAHGREAVVVERDGRPLAVLISPEHWERYQALAKADLFAAIARIHEANRDAPPEEIEREVAEAVEAVRRNTMNSVSGTPVVVFDSNITVSALVSPAGSSWRALAAWEEGACRAISSDDLFAELAAVLERPRIQAVSGRRTCRRANPPRFLHRPGQAAASGRPTDSLP
ncbi:MAG: type II toxin-antitoxin system prevent-host-death family antitoxin [Dehalococcoidia bacterium]